MESPFFFYNSQQSPPFSIFIEHRHKTASRSWEPAAFIKLTGNLRTSGLLFALPPEELRDFLFLLTFLTANGSVAPTLSQIAEGLQMSEFRARLQLKRLTARRWLDQSIVLPARYASGIEAYMLMPGLLPVVEEEQQPEPPQVIYGGHREQIIAMSRERYARPRAEVEYEINKQLREGRRFQKDFQKTAQPQEETEMVDAEPETANPLRDELIEVGLDSSQADSLIARYDALRIKRQLHWLPYRVVKNRAGFLIAAIKDNYEAPANMRVVSQSESDTPDQPTAESQPIEPQTPINAT